jgi:hypothetical protein
MAVQTRVKGNITEEELYHNRLRDHSLQQTGEELEFDIVTVKDLSMWPEKVRARYTANRKDVFIFQLRTHDYINLIRYGRTGEIHETFVSDVSSEGSSPSRVGGFYRKAKGLLKQKDNAVSRFVLGALKWFNWRVVRSALLAKRLVGGHERFALKRYVEVMEEAERLSNELGMELIFLGVTSRPGSWLENRLAYRLQNALMKKASELGRPYVDVLGKRDQDGNYKFADEGGFTSRLSLSAVGHKEISEKLWKELGKY